MPSARSSASARSSEASPASGAAHAARDGAEQRGAALGLRRLAEDMEAVPDLHLLDFAEIAVELAERVVAAVARPDAAILIQPDGAGKLQDARGERRTAARIERGGIEELVHEALQLLQCAVAAGARQRRRQVVDDHRRAPALGLAALAGVVHDEGIDVRERPERGLGEARGGERQRLARQPLHVAVLADVNDRVGVEGRAQPGVEGEVAVRRRQVGVVVALLGVDVVAPRRLDRDDDVAEARGGEREAAGAGSVEGVGLRRAPARGDRGADRVRQRGKESRIGGKRERGLGRFRAAVGGVGGASSEPRHQRRAVGRRVLHPVAGVPEGGHDVRRARRRVQADAVADAPVAVGVVGEHQGDAALRRGRAGETHPGGGQGGHEAAALRVRLRHHDGRLRRRVEARLGLERDRAGEDAPVDLGQRHVHGDVAGGQAARGLRPLPRRRAGEDRLQHGHAGLGERGLHGRAGAGDGEARGVQHDRRPGGAHERRDQLRRRRVPQAGDEDGERVEARVPECCDQRIHGRERAPLQQRAVEDHARPRRAAPPVAGQRLQVEHALARPVEARAGHRPGRLARAARARSAGRRSGARCGHCRCRRGCSSARASRPRRPRACCGRRGPRPPCRRPAARRWGCGARHRRRSGAPRRRASSSRRRAGARSRAARHSPPVRRSDRPRGYGRAASGSRGGA